MKETLLLQGSTDGKRGWLARLLGRPGPGSAGQAAADGGLFTRYHRNPPPPRVGADLPPPTNIPMPLDRPVKLKDLQLARQAELEATLMADPYVAMVSSLFENTAQSMGSEWHLRSSTILPAGFSTKLDEAVQRFKTATRLPLRVRCWMGDATTRTLSMAFRHQRELRFLLSPTLLRECDAQELSFHLGASAWHGLHPEFRPILLAMDAGVPFPLERKAEILEAARLRGYAAHWMGLLCGGDSALALRECGRRELGLDGRLLGADYLAYTDALAESGDLSVYHVLLSNGPLRSPLAAAPRQIALFEASGLCRGLRGQKGGTPREQFEAQVLELDRRVHPPLTSVPQEHTVFVHGTCAVVASFVWETSEQYSEEGLLEFLGKLGFSEDLVRSIATSIGWEFGPEGNTVQILNNLARGEHGHLGRVDSHQFMWTAAIAFLEVGEARTAETMERYQKVANWGEVHDGFGPRLLEYIANELAKAQSEEEPQA